MKPGRLLLLAGLCALVLLPLGYLLVGARAERELPASAAADELSHRRIRVEVLNAAGIPRLAQRGTDRLRDAGFDVVFYGNARGFNPDTSLVLDRVGDPSAAVEVAEALGIERVRSQPDTALYLEVTVVLGRDWGKVGGEAVAP